MLLKEMHLTFSPEGTAGRHLKARKPKTCYKGTWAAMTQASTSDTDEFSTASEIFICDLSEPLVNF